MSATVRVDRVGDHAIIIPTGPFDLAHTTAVARTVEGIERASEWLCLGRC